MSPAITHGLQHKLFHTTISKGLAPRQFTFVISSESVDRDRDIIKLNAWDFKEYMMNPAVLAAHNHQQLPVAKSVDIYKTDTAVVATAQFPPEGMYAYADTVHDLVEAGFLKAASVGFRADQAEPNGLGGHTITKATLLEWSICAIGSNPDALVQRSAPLMMQKWLTGGAWPRTSTEDTMKIGVDDEPYLEIDDTKEDTQQDWFGEMLAVMNATYPADHEFRELLRVQMSLLGPAGSIADLCRGIMQQGVVAPKSYDIDDRELARTIARVVASEIGQHTRAALNSVLGRLD